MRVIAIDGPAGAGKSTVARAVAERLGVDELDTGAMYRAVTLAVLREGADPADADAVAAIAQRVDIDAGTTVALDGADVTEAIRGVDVDRAVSVVAAHPAVRAELVTRQRAWVDAHGGGVVEGRDIGSVVFPDAQLKVFLTASDDERARRRGTPRADIDRRDHIDSTRAASPLKAADDAVVIDTTGRAVDQVVDEVLELLAARS